LFLDLPEGEKPIVFVTHNESTFNVNDGKRKIWKMDGINSLRPKRRRKGIMVSGFLTPGRRLKVPDDISNTKLLSDPTWPLDSNGIPVREARSFWNVERAVTGLETKW
jgi:hypothetical protein